jgi:hypothetical protein
MGCQACYAAKIWPPVPADMHGPWLSPAGGCSRPPPGGNCHSSRLSAPPAGGAGSQAVGLIGVRGRMRCEWVR